MTSVFEAIKGGLASSATAYAVVIDGVLDVRTCRTSRNEAAYSGVVIVSKAIVLTNCATPDCDCMVKLLAERSPESKIVPVKIEVQP